MQPLPKRSGKYTTQALAVISFLCVLLISWSGAPNHTASAALAPLEEGTEPLPPGVRIETVLEDMEQPVAFAFDPEGRIFYTEKASGNVRLIANGVLQTQPVITFEVSFCSERGLLGIAVDPNFASNRYIYVYYTEGPDCRASQNTLVRFIERDGRGFGIEELFGSPQPGGPHEGGNIHFGPDGKLYVSIGDGGEDDNGQFAHVTNAKILRMNSDGTAPNDNPHFPIEGANPYAYAMGFRNTFDFTFDPVVRGRIFGTENGPECDDEMNRIEPGNNYGWRRNYPCDDARASGPDPAYNTIAPLWYLPASQCCEAPTGIAFYTGGKIPEWQDQLFMGAYNGSKLRHFYLNADHTALTAVKVVQGVNATVDIETGPDGAFYYIEAGGNQRGTLKRIVGSAQPATQTPTPNAQVTAVPTAVSTPNITSTVTIPGTGSQTFPETGRTVSGIFLDYWNKNGGLAQQGYPISALMSEVSDLDGKAYTVQYFERAVFEYHPEIEDPTYKVLLSQLGTFQYRKKYPQGAPDQKPSTENPIKFEQTGKTMGGKFRQYWESHGGLAQQGYPISEEFTEVSDLNGKPYLVQYFERAVFELHPENAGTQYEVLLSQLGTFRYREKYGR
jgi:glucose/arabinose dehydrogenase